MKRSSSSETARQHSHSISTATNSVQLAEKLLESIKREIAAGTQVDPEVVAAMEQSLSNIQRKRITSPQQD